MLCDLVVEVGPRAKVFSLPSPHRPQVLDKVPIDLIERGTFGTARVPTVVPRHSPFFAPDSAEIGTDQILPGRLFKFGAQIAF